MFDLAITSGYLAISSDSQTVAIDLKSDSCPAFHIERPIGLNTDKVSDKSAETTDGNTPIVSSSFSNCGDLFVCCCQKNLSAWYVKDWKLLGKKTIQRSANRVLFGPKNNILVADKSGDVYLHLLNDFDSPGTLLLGHLSMLLDILVTPDENFIITCDRDEKIRVSLFPKSYIIHSYCLGHEDFVTSIRLLSHDSSVLISSSGDGTIRFWNYETGKETLCYAVANDLTNRPEVEISQVIPHRIMLSAIDFEASSMYSAIFKVNAILVHEVRGKGPNISCKLVEIIETGGSPMCFQIDNGNKLLWVICNSVVKELLGFEFKTNGVVKSESDIVCKVQDIVSKYSILIKDIDLHERFISSLVKKRFDNEGEYYKRKQERLEKKNVKKMAT